MGEGMVVFKEKEIRRTLHKNEWWFSIIDIISVLAKENYLTVPESKKRLGRKETK